MNNSDPVFLYISAKYINSTKSFDSVLSVGISATNGPWYYAEILGHKPDDVEPEIMESVFPHLMKISGTKFLPLKNVKSRVASWIDEISMDGNRPIVVRYASDSGSIAAEFIRDSIPGGIQFSIEERLINSTLYAEFVKKCGGEARVGEHSLVESLGYALCDLNRVERVSIHENSITHLELLMGSKNSTSYRAWARSVEKSREAKEFHENAVKSAQVELID